MSTRCQIGFYDKEPANLKKWEALIYRHSDGYPGTVDGKQYGVLCELVPFLREFAKKRGADSEYRAARFLQSQTNAHDAHMAEFEKKNNKGKLFDQTFVGTLGFGVCRAFHGDIEYYYAVYPETVKVFKVTYDQESYNFNEPEAWTLIQAIGLNGGSK